MAVVVYQYTGDKVLMVPGFGKWLKIKSGDTIVVSKHIVCKDCSRCPGKAVVIDPPDINCGHEGICFMETGHSIFPLTKVMEVRVDRNTLKGRGRLLRPF